MFGGLFTNLESNVEELNGESAAIGLKKLVAEELTPADISAARKLVGGFVSRKYKGVLSRSPPRLLILRISCQNSPKRNLTATPCLTVAVLLLHAGEVSRVFTVSLN